MIDPLNQYTPALPCPCSVTDTVSMWSREMAEVLCVCVCGRVKGRVCGQGGMSLERPAHCPTVQRLLCVASADAYAERMSSLSGPSGARLGSPPTDIIRHPSTPFPLFLQASPSIHLLSFPHIPFRKNLSSLFY